MVHGAWSTKTCFNYLTQKALDHGGVGKIHYFEYDCQKEHSVDLLRRAHEEYDTVSENGLDTIIVGHSLGGILAMYLAKYDNVHRVITLAAPLSGITSLNNFVHYFLVIAAPIFRCLQPKSAFIKDLHEQDYTGKDIDVLVACAGFNVAMPNEPSDGTISIASQNEWLPDNANVQMVKSNHHEILQSAEAVLALERALEATP